MFSILYINEDRINQLGPFATEELAMAEAKREQGYSFNIVDQKVYIMRSNGMLYRLMEENLGVHWHLYH